VLVEYLFLGHAGTKPAKHVPDSDTKAPILVLTLDMLASPSVWHPPSEKSVEPMSRTTARLRLPCEGA